MGLDITKYYSASEYLRDCYVLKKQLNSAFSIRAWANKIGLKSHGALQQIINGKRQLPKSYLTSISASLNLSEEEMKYLDVVIDYERSKSATEREYFAEKMDRLRPKIFEDKFKQINNYQFFKNPLHSIILTMMRRDGFVLDIEGIKKSLCFPVTTEELNDVVQRLVDFNLIRINGSQVTVADYHVRNLIDVPSKIVQRYHQKMSLVARDQIAKQRTEDREYNSISFNIKKSSIPKAKKKLRNLINEFLEEFSTLERSSVTYHLNNQLFALTKNIQNNQNVDKEVSHEKNVD